MLESFSARLVLSLSMLAITLGCNGILEPKGHPESVVLLATPKIISDFNNPEPSIRQFLDNYKSLLSPASEAILIFAVGNSDHILYYAGPTSWNQNIEWARTTNFIPVSDATLSYRQIANIVQVFKTVAKASGITLKVYDQIESGNEFTISNVFKYSAHPECTNNKWAMYDIRGQLAADPRAYASAPNGITAGTLCGTFLVDQVSHYMNDLAFDGILYGNQLGTRGRWYPGDGPGYSAEEAAAIQSFLDYSRASYGSKDLMWFDSYNNVDTERTTFSFPEAGYDDFSHVIASGFCVILEPFIYKDNLESKLNIRGRPKILATLDYVDPWYEYNSMTNFSACSKGLEQYAVVYRDRIDGIMFFANDEVGRPVPKTIVDQFAKRFF
jgi:hypothetical protein